MSAAVATTTTEMNERTPLVLVKEPPEPPPPESPIAATRRDRSDSVMDVLVEAVVEVKDALVETAVEVQEVVAEGMEEIQHVLEEPILPPELPKPRAEGSHEQKLGATALAVLVFYKVSGGPFGCEPAVQAAGGPFYALAGFALFPLFWCIPEALITAELGSAYPEPSGAIAWVEEAFGPKASLLAGYFHYVSGSTDNAIYPSLFLKYIASAVLGELFEKNAWLRFVFAVTISIVLSIVNYFGLEIVGNLSMAVCAMSMSPFLVLCLAAVPKLNPSRWLVRPSRPIHWRPFLNSLFWNLNSFDAGANFSGEVQDPERVFPRAMFMSVGMVAASYLLPLLAAIGAADTNPDDWNAGYFTTVSAAIAGPWLGVWIVFAAAISNIALYEAELSGDAYQLLGMAERGMIPKLFVKRSRFGTPTNGILTGTIIIIIMSMADFEELVEMLNFAYAFSFLLEFAAFVKLRITHADFERPYKIPLNTFGCVLFVLPPCLFLVYVLLFASKLTYIYCAVLVLLGIVLDVAQKVVKHYSFLEYVEARSRTQRRAGAIVQP